MKINSSTEQGVFVVLLLALQKDHVPVKSSILSEILGVSDSYLKKILRKLVVAGIVDSNASKDGGFTLTTTVDRITFADVFAAVEKFESTLHSSSLAAAVFGNEEHVRRSIDTVESTLARGVEKFLDALGGLRLSELLEEGSWESGSIDWRTYPRKSADATKG